MNTDLIILFSPVFPSFSQPSQYSVLQKQTDKVTKSPITTQQSTYHEAIEDEEMDQVVTSNAVDYNTNDSKYMYDDFTENDYIATGDIVTTSTVTPTTMNTIQTTHYTNSNYNTTMTTADGTNILNSDQILSGNNQIGKYTAAGQPDNIPVSQNTLLSSHKTNLYCDSDSTAYDLIDTQHHVDDDINKIGNNNYLRDHDLYDDRYLDTSGNIIFNQNQPVSVELTREVT